MIAERIDPMAEAAWLAYRETFDAGSEWPMFGDLAFDEGSHEMRQAFTAAARASLRHWFENEFQAAVGRAKVVTAAFVGELISDRTGGR